MKIVSAKYIPEGKLALLLDGVLVWYGSFDAPVEDDIVADTLVMSPIDYDKLSDKLLVDELLSDKMGIIKEC